jgi:hypothetical protein
MSLFIFHRDPCSFTHGTIARVENAIHEVSIFIRFARLPAVPNALHKVLHLALISISECFLRKWLGPAEIYVRLLDYVA